MAIWVAICRKVLAGTSDVKGVDANKRPPSMINSFDNQPCECAQRNAGSPMINGTSDRTAQSKALSRQGATFSKVFRWQPAGRHSPTPTTVEVVGSFSDWQALPLARDRITDTWQLTLDGISGNRTHRYMLLVDGVPADDKNCDGLAVPEGFVEQQHQLMTARGPRVFLLFAQTK
ncbi:MAG: glycogen-binding domain-containing protein [Verrucomicrobiota bacterium]